MNDDLNIIKEQTYRVISDLPYTNTNISRNYREQLKVIEEAAERMANRIAELEKENKILKEFEGMYKGLCK